MTGIEEIIERSRAKGGFTTKGSFTLASDKARIKVSEFALPDPYLYCIEFIQSAVALKATYLDAVVNESTFILSICGVRFSRENLARMFEFLLIDNQDDVVRAHRRLAVGTSAALSLSGATVFIESGDGTLEGSTRFECTGIQREATIGTPAVPIDGTFIKVSHAFEASAIDGTFMEQGHLLARCRFLPLTLVLNGELPFGYTFSRAIRLPMYPHRIGFDDGDFYGGLALDDGTSPKVVEGIRVLTNGVEITSIASPCVELPPSPPSKSARPLGLPAPKTLKVVGAVTYDRLRKTASQYEIVQDERQDELRQRLKPFADELFIKAGVPDEARLRYLLDKDAPELNTWGAKYRMILQTEPFEVAGTFGLSSVQDESPGIRISATYLTKSIQFLGFEFPLPVRGKIVFKGNCLSALRLVRPGDDDFSQERAVLLTPEMKQRIEGAIQSEYHALKRHVEGQLEERQTKQKKKPIVSKKDTAASDEFTKTALGIALDSAARSTSINRVHTTAEFDAEDTKRIELNDEAQQELSALLARRDALFLEDGAKKNTSTKPVLPTSVKLDPVAAAVKTAAYSAPKATGLTYSMPTPTEIRETFGACENNQAKQVAFCNFLRRILHADPTCRHFFAVSKNRVVLAEATPPTLPAWVDMQQTRFSGNIESPLYVNLLHPKIGTYFEACTENPSMLYAAALLIRVEISLRLHENATLRQPPDNEPGLARAVLGVL